MERIRSTDSGGLASGGSFFVFGLDQPIMAAVPKDWAPRGPSGQLISVNTLQAPETQRLRVRFQILTEKWKKETKFSSSLRDLVSNESYRKIMDMGEDAIPLILEDLRARPARWFWALSAITGENPVASDHRGTVAKMRRDWIDWGVKKGFLDEDKG